MSPGRPPSPAAPGFGAVLHRLRESRRMSMNALGECAGFDHSYISRIESGQRTPTRNAVGAMADAMFCDRAETDALLAAAGFLPVGSAPPLTGEPEVAAALAVLTDPAVPEGRKAWLRRMIRGLLDGC